MVQEKRSLSMVWRGFTAAAMMPVMVAAQDDVLPKTDPVQLAMLRKPEAVQQIFAGDFQRRNGLSRVLGRYGVSGRDSYLLGVAMQDVFDPRHIRSDMGYEVTMVAATMGDDPQVQQFILRLDEVDYVQVDRLDGGGYAARQGENETEMHVYYRDIEITSSLYKDAAEAGVPVHHIQEAIRLLSWDVDFQRDIHDGNRLKLYYQVPHLGGQVIKDRGDVLHFSLDYGMKSDQSVSAYRFEDADARVEYYDADGKGLKRGVLKTPVDGARISSGFDMNRLHPIYKVKKPHIGIDFAAPEGTDIQAAGDGEVIDVGSGGGCGRRIVIKHSSLIKYREKSGDIKTYNEWMTGYCHLSKMAPDVKKGTMVQQGQWIGDVGVSGDVTAAHLHLSIRLQMNDGKKYIKAGWGDDYTGFKPSDWQRVTGDVVQVIDPDMRAQFMVSVSDMNSRMGFVHMAEKQTMSSGELDYHIGDALQFSPIESVAMCVVPEQEYLNAQQSCLKPFLY